VKKGMLLCRGVLALMIIVGCWSLVAAAEKKKTHPKLSEQEKNISCAQCHEEVPRSCIKMVRLPSRNRHGQVLPVPRGF